MICFLVNSFTSRVVKITNVSILLIMNWYIGQIISSYRWCC